MRAELAAVGHYLSSKRVHRQAVSGYWQTHATLNRWRLINSYLTTTRNHGLTVLDAITRALTGRPWLPAAA